jgi:pyridoxine 5-phosphate synthase
MTKLSVNVNKVALLRNARTLGIPSVVRCATIALDAGADGITVHPRPDERHIRREDVFALAELISSRPGIELNIEGNPFHQLLEIVRAVRPHQCTLVPDEVSAATSDHGWDLDSDGERLGPIIAECRALGVRVSLFMDPIAQAIPKAKALGADRIELYTEPYASAFGSARVETELLRYAKAARAAVDAGLGVNAGHDLNRQNLPVFLKNVDHVLEVSIGHALIADALELGLDGTVRAYLEAIESAYGRATPGVRV